MKKLTKREKTLLLVLLLVIIVAGGVYFLILPTVERSDAMNDELATGEMSYSEMRLQAAQLPVLEQRLEEARAALDEAGARPLPAMSNDELDALLTGMVIQAGLAPEGLEMADAGLGGIYPYGTDATAEDAVAAGAANMNTAVLSARGDLDGAQALIAAIAANDAMLLTDWSAELDDGLGSGEYAIVFNVTVFMQ